MIYLYAGMGVAMLTAIMAMFEMANGLTGQQMFSRPPKDVYLQSVHQTYDQSFLRLIESMDTSWNCPMIRQEIESNPLFSNIKSYRDGLPSESTHQLLMGSCVFSNGNHRVLISPLPQGSTKSHRLFSCLLVDEVMCSFEKARG